MPRALILGVDGQDGSYLADLLLERGYQVTGWVPVAIPLNHQNLDHLQGRIELLVGDLSHFRSLEQAIASTRPDEIYNLAAPSYPAASWDDPLMVGDIAGLGAARLLEAMRLVNPRACYYQASTSELFGNPAEVPQNESTPFHPRNPYGIAKLYAHWTTVRYRERYGLYACCGILYNHESPRRGHGFVTRKVSLGAARIKLGLQADLHLGDLEARRDWGYAGDYVEAMWRMLHQPSADDYVIGSGETHSVRELCQLAFACLDLDYRDYVRQDAELTRPPEAAQLVADPRKARQRLGWEPQVSFPELVRLMVMADYNMLAKTGDPGG
jgi:GDPmannose 4,6-dehydratase